MVQLQLLVTCGWSDREVSRVPHVKWMRHVTYVYGSCHLWISPVASMSHDSFCNGSQLRVATTHDCVLQRLTTCGQSDTKVSHVTHVKWMCHVTHEYESCHMWIRHVTCMSYGSLCNGLWPAGSWIRSWPGSHVWKCDVTRVYTSCHTCISHGTCE